jgi:hypothetical protein
MEFMECPHCKSHNLRRSHRRGLWEGLILRIILRAPFRCGDCNKRFWGFSRDPHFRRSKKPHSFAGYLGIYGKQKKKLKKLLLLLVILIIGSIFAFYFALYLADKINHPSPPPEAQAVVLDRVQFIAKAQGMPNGAKEYKKISEIL